jgi:hypothetical protein
MRVVSPEKEGRQRLVVRGDNGVARLLYLVVLSLLTTARKMLPPWMEEYELPSAGCSAMMILPKCVDMCVLSPEKEGRRREGGGKGAARLLYLLVANL